MFLKSRCFEPPGEKLEFERSSIPPADVSSPQARNSSSAKPPGLSRYLHASEQVFLLGLEFVVGDDAANPELIELRDLVWDGACSARR